MLSANLATLFAALTFATFTLWCPITMQVYVAELVIILTAFVMVVIGRRPENHFLGGLSLIAALCVAQLICGATSVPLETGKGVIYWITLCGISYIATLSGSQDAVLNWLATLGSLIAGLALAQFFTSSGKIFWMWPGPEPYAVGPFLSRNNLASFSLLMMPIIIWKASAAVGTPAWVWWLAAVLSFASIAATGSRAGSALAVCELLVLGTRANRRSLLVSVPLLAVAIFGWELLAAKAFGPAPFPYRLEMAGSAFAMFLAAPLMGFGAGSFPLVYPGFASFDSGHFVNHAHNDYLEFAAGGGLLFLAVFAALAVYLSIKCMPIRWAIGVPAVLLHALVDYPLQRLGIMGWVIFVGALAVAADKRMASPAGFEPALPP
ncbi:MAG: O-antigen ligase family protein [Candidatus Solibacter usitatus]|nr:O-antigen ligase family protein [Candidatus Solibacter usitatus]